MILVLHASLVTSRSDVLWLALLHIWVGIFSLLISYFDVASLAYAMPCHFTIADCMPCASVNYR